MERIAEPTKKIRHKFLPMGNDSSSPPFPFCIPLPLWTDNETPRNIIQCMKTRLEIQTHKIIEKFQRGPKGQMQETEENSEKRRVFSRSMIYFYDRVVFLFILSLPRSLIRSQTFFASLYKRTAPSSIQTKHNTKWPIQWISRGGGCRRRGCKNINKKNQSTIESSRLGS